MLQSKLCYVGGGGGVECLVIIGPRRVMVWGGKTAVGIEWRKSSRHISRTPITIKIPRT